MGGESVTMCTTFVQQPHKIFLLGVHNLNSMAGRVPTHVPASRGPFVYCRRTSLHISCMQLISKIPSALGLRCLGKYLLVLDPNVLYTPHALFRWSGLIYMNDNPNIYLRGPLTRPNHQANLLNLGADVRSPKRWALCSGPVHKPRMFELKLISVKRLISRPRWPSCLMSEAMHTMFWGDVAPHSITSVHVAITNGWETLPLAFPLYINPSKSYAPFTVSFPFALLFRILYSLSSSNPPPRLTSSIASRCVFLSSNWF